MVERDSKGLLSVMLVTARPFSTIASLLALFLLSGCERDKAVPTATDAAPPERSCHLVGLPQIPIASELGQKIEVPRGTNCVVLDDGAALMRIRITNGPFVDAVAWAPTAAVASGKSPLPPAK